MLIARPPGGAQRAGTARRIGAGFDVMTMSRDYKGRRGSARGSPAGPDCFSGWSSGLRSASGSIYLTGAAGGGGRSSQSGRARDRNRGRRPRRDRTEESGRHSTSTRCSPSSRSWCPEKEARDAADAPEPADRGAYVLQAGSYATSPMPTGCARNWPCWASSRRSSVSRSTTTPGIGCGSARSAIRRS